MTTDHFSDFRAVLESAGLCPTSIATDGTFHRWGTVGKEQGADGSYVLYPDFPKNGHCWNFQTCAEGVWTDKSSTPLSNEARANIERARRARQQTVDTRHVTACRTAQSILSSARPGRSPLSCSQGRQTTWQDLRRQGWTAGGSHL